MKPFIGFLGSFKMKKLFLLLLLALTLIQAPSFEAQIPTRLFNVQSGNGAVENGVTYTRATLIAFKDNASKDAVIDAVCVMGGYQDTIDGQPNPQSKQQFFNERIEQFLRDNYKAAKISAAEKAAKATAEAAANAELPIR